MSSTPTISLLSGLVKGYHDTQTAQARQDLETNAMQREQMLTYLGHMATNPNIPPEHQQWAMTEGQKLLQLPVGKPIKNIGDLSTLPPASVQRPPRQAVSQTPAAPALMRPVGPQAQGPQSSEVGRQTGGAVNAIGAAAASPQLTLPVGPNLAAVQNPQLLPAMPAGPQKLIQNPQAPEQIAAGGGVHVLTPEDRLKYASSAQDTEINRLQEQYPNRSREDLAYFAEKGVFPKPNVHNLAPGGELVDETTGRVIARNTEAKPGAKSGFKIRNGPGGEPLAIENNATGADMTPEEIAANPEAKALMDAAGQSHQKSLREAEDKQQRQFTHQAQIQAQAFANALALGDARAARREVDSSFKDYNESLNRMSTMDKNLESALKGDQQSMLSLVANHIGMTLGAQKGARINQAVWNEAVASTPWLDKIEAKFDSRGYLSGVTLAPDQMKSMVRLAHEKVDTQKASYDRMTEHYHDQLPQGRGGKGGKSLQKPVGGTTPTAPSGGFNWDDHPVVKP